MVTITAPADGRRQYSFTDIAMAHAVTGVGLGAFQQISPSAYVVRGSWPKPPTNNSSFSSSVAASVSRGPEAEAVSGSAARSLWPNLR
jgi:hypothetical protein